MTFDHLGVLVPDLDSGRALLAETLGLTAWTEAAEEPAQDVFVQFGRGPSGPCYELIAPRSERSPVRRALAGRINTLNHVAYLTANLDGDAARLMGRGFVAAGPRKPGCVFGGGAIGFFVSPGRLMIELIEAPMHRHDFHDTREAA